MTNPSARDPQNPALGDVILEYTPVGRVMRVCAVDTATGVEVVIQGPVDAPEHQLKATALAKLAYRLRKDQQGRSGNIGGKGGGGTTA